MLLFKTKTSAPITVNPNGYEQIELDTVFDILEKALNRCEDIRDNTEKKLANKPDKKTGERLAFRLNVVKSEIAYGEHAWDILRTHEDTPIYCQKGAIADMKEWEDRLSLDYICDLFYFTTRLHIARDTVCMDAVSLKFAIKEKEVIEDAYIPIAKLDDCKVKLINLGAREKCEDMNKNYRLFICRDCRKVASSPKWEDKQRIDAGRSPVQLCPRCIGVRKKI